jgi:hypothetical protein
VSHLAQEEEDTEDDEEYDGQDDGEGQPCVSQLENIVQVVRGQVHLQDILRGFRICGHPDVVQPKKNGTLRKDKELERETFAMYLRIRRCSKGGQRMEKLPDFFYRNYNVEFF